MLLKWIFCKNETLSADEMYPVRYSKGSVGTTNRPIQKAVYIFILRTGLMPFIPPVEIKVKAALQPDN
jgi:hypothetical protein